MADNGRIGVWLNKRLVKSLELPFPHEVNDGPQPESWLLQVTGDGRAVANFVDGDATRFDLRAGDFVMASAEAIYVSRSLEGTDARGNVTREARLAAVEASGGAPKPAAKRRPRARTSGSRSKK